MDNKHEDPLFSFTRRDITVPEQGQLLVTCYQREKILCRGVALSLFTGMRRREALSLRYRDIDLPAKTITILPSKGVRAASGYVFPVTETLAAWLEIFPAGAPDDRVVPFTPGDYNQRIWRTMRRTGIGPFSSDFLRRAYFLTLSPEGVPLQEKQAAIFAALTPSALKLSPLSS